MAPALSLHILCQMAVVMVAEAVMPGRWVGASIDVFLYFGTSLWQAEMA